MLDRMKGSTALNIQMMKFISMPIHSSNSETFHLLQLSQCQRTLHQCIQNELIFDLSGSSAQQPPDHHFVEL
jgi:hypothetical protein